MAIAAAHFAGHLLTHVVGVLQGAKVDEDGLGAAAASTLVRRYR